MDVPSSTTVGDACFSPTTGGDGKRKRNRKAKKFADYVAWEEEATTEREEPTDDGQHHNKRNRKGKSTATQQTPNQSSPFAATPVASPSPSDTAPATDSHDTIVSVKKVAGVQNATRKALEWLQYGDMSLVELGQSLPKLSKARVEVVMEALRAAGLVTLVRKHAPNAMGEDHVTEVYRFSAGRSPATALEIGGGRPVSLGSISKRIKTSQAELTGLNERINVLKAEAAKADPEPQQVLEILQHLMKQDKSLEEDPFYSVAYKATCTAATKAAKAAAAAARATAAAQARKKAAENAVAVAASAAAAEATRQAQEAARRGKEQESSAAVLQPRTDMVEGQEEAKAVHAREAAAAAATVAAATAAAATAAAATAASAAAATAAVALHTTASLTSGSGATSGTGAVSALPTSTLSPAAPAPSPPPALATAIAEPPNPFVGELGGLVVSSTNVAPCSIPPAPPAPPGGPP
ncbi:unnamed protein product [Ectocarpus sp. CCAP 1310/34]|nr:unnamed protein product [Ectocarpus sp. CCAP 1310/34]